MSAPCEDHGAQLEPDEGESRPCGICGFELYQAPVLIACTECPTVFGVRIPDQWIGDAWVTPRSETIGIASGVTPVAAEVLAHYQRSHPERLCA